MTARLSDARAAEGSIASSASAGSKPIKMPVPTTPTNAIAMPTGTCSKIIKNRAAKPTNPTAISSVMIAPWW